jgi:riboflavin biosynthesis pyrimidine reductase
MATAAEITAMVQRWLATEVAREVLAERARCAAVCRAMATALDDDTALACAEAIERGPVTP